MLRAYEAFLTKKGSVRTQSVPYYVKWISDCYGFLNEPLFHRLGSKNRNHDGDDCRTILPCPFLWVEAKADISSRLLDLNLF